MLPELGLTSWEGKANFTATAQSIDAQRALVGMYYLSCGICVLGTSQPQILAHNDFIVEAARYLARHGDQPGDKHMASIVFVMSRIEKVRLSLSSKGSLLNLHGDDPWPRVQRDVEELSAMPGLPPWFQTTLLYRYVGIQSRHPPSSADTPRQCDLCERVQTLT